MNNENWKKIKDLFHEALEIPFDERERFLATACRDENIREEVRQLLASYGEDEQFLETVAIGEVAEMFVETAGKIKDGAQIGRYRIRQLLGKGGMGEVYLAEDTELERLVALKILSILYSNDDNRVSRFLQEAKAASGLNHPNILTVHEIGRFQDTYYIATEYIKGETLRERADRRPLALREIIDFSRQILSALKIAHEAGIVHRDIKPENIMLRDDGIVKILDFGLAKLIGEQKNGLSSRAAKNNLVDTAPNVIVGTVAYMSPEQARGNPTDGRSDLWSFGVCLYEMLAGFHPFKDDSPSDQIVRILTSAPEPLPLDVPPELNRIVGKALQKNREARYQSAHEMADELRHFENSLKAGAHETDYLEARPTAIKRAFSGFSQLTANLLPDLRVRSWLLFASPIVLLMLLFASGYYFYRKNEIYRPRPEAVRWFREGSEAARAGNYYKAKKLFEQAVAEDDSFPAAQAKLAEMWLELDYEDKAAQTMLRVTELMSERSNFAEEEKIYLQALLATVRRDARTALAVYEKIAAAAPEEKKAAALFDVAKTLEKLEDAPRAIEIYEEIVRRDPQFAAAYMRLGELYWHREGEKKALAFFEQAAVIFNARSDYDGLGELYYQKGNLYNIYDKLPEALENLEKSLDLARATSNLHLQVKTSLSLGRIVFTSGETSRAKRLIDETLNLARAEKLENLTTTGLIDFGTVLYLQGEYAPAEQYFQQALQIARLNGGKRAEARALVSLGNLALLRVKPQQAIEFIKPALDFFTINDFKQEKQKALLALAYAYDQAAEYRRALDLLNGLREEAAQADDRAMLAHCFAAAGLTSIHTEKFSEALNYFENSLRLNESLGREQVSAYDSLNQAQSLIHLGQFEKARESLRQTIGAANKTSDKQLLAWTHLMKAQTALFEDDHSEAVDESRLAIATSDGQIDEILISANTIAALTAARRGDPAEAIEYLQKASEVLNKTENPRLEVNIQLARAEILLKKGSAAEALETALKAKEIFQRQGAGQSEWRAAVVASAACALLGDDSKAREYAEQAVFIAATLEQNWGPENYQNYLKRKDVRFYLSQIEKFTN